MYNKIHEVLNVKSQFEYMLREDTQKLLLLRSIYITSEFRHTI